MIAPSQNHESIANRPEFKGPVKELLRLTENAVLLRSPDGCFYAHVSVGGRSETYPIRSAAFRDWLIAGYFRPWGELPSDWSLRRVRGKLEATARFDGGTPSIFVRVGHDGSVNRNGNSRAWYLDLCDPEGKAVNRRDASMTNLDESPVAAFLLDLGPDYINDWSGTPSELLTELALLAGKQAESPRWPKSPDRLAVELRQVAPQLGIHGILADFYRTNRGRVVSLKCIRAVA